MKSPAILAAHPLVSDQVNKTELAVILKQLEGVLLRGVAGDVVEFGCYSGTTSLFLRRLLDAYDAGMSLHVYDSFEGLPNKTSYDHSAVGEQFKAGELAVSKKALIAHFTKAHLQLPVIHRGWFSDLTAADVPEHIAFAYLDGDFYASIMDPLKLVWPRLAEGGVICIDDYGRDALPGVTAAVETFFRDKQVNIRHEASIAVVTRQPSVSSSR